MRPDPVIIGYPLAQNRVDLVHDSRVVQNPLSAGRLRQRYTEGYFRYNDRVAKLTGRSDDPRTLEETTYGRPVEHTPGVRPSESYLEGLALREALKDQALRREVIAPPEAARRFAA